MNLNTIKKCMTVRFKVIYKKKVCFVMVPWKNYGDGNMK